MVQKGKFSAATVLLVRALKKEDFPTLGRPTIPILRLLPGRPRRGFSVVSCFFFGGMVGWEWRCTNGGVKNDSPRSVNCFWLLTW